MLVKDILRQKNNKIISVTPDITLLDTIKHMVKNHVSSVMIMEGEKLTGILTERDVLNLSATRHDEFHLIKVSEVMSKNLDTRTSEADIDEILNTMVEKKFRHMPIVEDDKLVGLISIRDAIRAKYRKTENENKHLKAYMYGHHI